MKIKNVSGKIINVGDLTLLPQEVGVVPAKFETNPNIDALCEMDFLVKVKDSVKATDEAPRGEIPEGLDKMKRDELVEICEKHGIEVGDVDTKAMLCEKIREVLA